MDRETAEDLASYNVRSFIYKYHSVYGSPPVNTATHTIRGVRVSDDGLRARLIVDGLRQHYVHHLTLDGIRSRDEGDGLVHPNSYYTLNRIPAGTYLALAEVSTRDSRRENGGRPREESLEEIDGVPTLVQAMPLLSRNTCMACHSVDQRQVGPSFRAIAQRSYTDEQVVNFIHQPENRNWPDFATPMPPMPHVPEDEARAIASWINSLVDDSHEEASE